MLRHVTCLLLLAVLVSSIHEPLTSSRHRLRERNVNPDLRGLSRHNKGPPKTHIPKSPESRAVEDYLLPTSTYPLTYDLSIIPYLATPVEKNFTFDATVTVRIAVAQATSSIVMHAWDLTIATIDVVKVSDQTTVAVNNYDIVPDDRQFFSINVASSLEFNEEYDITVTYTGILNDEIYGFFRSGYIDENGNQDWLAITDLEPVGARRFMPCYDQPDLKARVTIRLARQPGYTVLANMPVAVDDGEPVEGLPGWEWVQFQQSPPIATYLICFSTNKFSSITSLEDIRYKVWARPATVQYGQYTTEITPGIIRYFDQFTSMPFQLPKYDQIALVEFFSGAMENWGLVTYLEPYVLYNAVLDDSWDKTVMAQVVAHETAHQWFGDAVSPKWWSSLWLNEGFATYFEYWGLSTVGADWQMDQQFVVDMMYSAFRVDTSNSHAIYADFVDSPDSIFTIFDSITYNKGGCLVRFMLNFMGEDNFKLGIASYLNIMGYSSAHQDDLFAALTPYAPSMPNGVTFKSMMDTWTLQAGFPLVTVTRNYADNTATVTQTRYGDSGTESWVVPLTYTGGDNPDFTDQSARAWLLPSESETTLQSGVPGPSQWLLLNIKQTGFYRVNYDQTNWGLLTDYLSTPGNAITFDPVNRAQVMDDAFTLAEASMLDYVTALTTTLYLDQESLLVPWEVAIDHLEFIRDRVYSTVEGISIYQDYMRRKLNFAYNTVNGFTVSGSDEHATLLTRWVITREACAMDHVACLNDGSEVFQQWVDQADPDTNNPIVLDLRTPSYCAAQRTGGQSIYDFLITRYTNSNSASDRDRMLMAMGCTDDAALRLAYLEESLTTDVIRPGDGLDVLEAVYSLPNGVDVALDFLVQNWRELDPIYGGVGYGFRAIATKLNTQAHYDTISQFRDANSAELSGGNMALISTALNTVQRHIDWNTNYLEPIMEFFRQN